MKPATAFTDQVRKDLEELKKKGEIETYSLESVDEWGEMLLLRHIKKHERAFKKSRNSYTRKRAKLLLKICKKKL